MKLKTQLLAAPLLSAAVALGAGGVYAWLDQRSAQREHAALEHDMADYKTIGQVQLQLGNVQAGVYRTLAILDSFDEARTKAFVDGVAQEVQGMKRALAALADDKDPELKKQVEATAPLLDRYLQQLRKAIELTAVEVNMGVAAMKAAEASHGELVKSSAAIAARTDSAYRQRQASAEAGGRNLMLWCGLLGLLATAAAVVGSWRVQRRLASELGRAAALSREVAEGRLGADIGSTRADEIGELVRGQGEMVRRLRESLLTVQQASSSIGSAASEIASGNNDLSRRTEQTASSLQQTASSMEQLTGTVRQSADAASQANQLASSAAQVAQRGGQVVAQVVSTMDEINASSRRIGDIIGTIDGIAFQTNILALNAAVEAARAGEQGRGFAVVAGEVRSLAPRAAEAAREIKSLIGASVERVETGTRQVRDAGGTMDEIVASVQRVSDIIAEISAAAGEQSAGIGQVNQAVTQLDQMTQQNAALVEQSAAAAESLKEQAQRLAEVLVRFDLGGSAPVAAAASMAAAGATATAPPPPKAAPPAAVAARVPAAARQASASAMPQQPQPQAKAATPVPAAQPSGGNDDWETF